MPADRLLALQLPPPNQERLHPPSGQSPSSRRPSGMVPVKGPAEGGGQPWGCRRTGRKAWAATRGHTSSSHLEITPGAGGKLTRFVLWVCSPGPWTPARALDLCVTRSKPPDLCVERRTLTEAAKTSSWAQTGASPGRRSESGKWVGVAGWVRPAPPSQGVPTISKTSNIRNIAKIQNSNEHPCTHHPAHQLLSAFFAYPPRPLPTPSPSPSLLCSLTHTHSHALFSEPFESKLLGFKPKYFSTHPGRATSSHIPPHGHIPTDTQDYVQIFPVIPKTHFIALKTTRHPLMVHTGIGLSLSLLTEHPCNPDHFFLFFTTVFEKLRPFVLQTAPLFGFASSLDLAEPLRQGACPARRHTCQSTVGDARPRHLVRVPSALARCVSCFIINQ